MNPNPMTHRIGPAAERRRPKAAAWIAVLMIGVSNVACVGAEGANRARAEFRDSAGVRIAENPSPDDSADLVWWQAEGPDLDIGGEGVTEEYALFRITDAVRLPDGRFVVANNGASDLRFYDADGQHVGTVGRQGEGPGEFRNVSAIFEGPGDSLTVYDGQARRFSVISMEPAFARDFRFSDANAVSLVIGRTAAGQFVSLPIGMRGDPDDLPNGLVRSDQAVALHGADGSIVDTIGVFPGPERMINIRRQGTQIVSIEIASPPFARTPTFALSGRSLWVATQDGPEVARYSLEGTLELLLRTGRQQIPVTDEHVNALIENRLESAPPEAHAGIRSGYESMPRAELIPPYGTIRVDAAGRLWVADFADPLAPPGRYTVYGPDGGILARIALPDRFTPLDIGEDWILGREFDDLDVEHLRLYRIIE